jgi:hypothetical protein
MKKIIIRILGLIPLYSFSQNTIIDTVSTSATYQNQVWYSLLNDEVKSTSKDNWDLAFEIKGFYSSILANTQKTGLKVYQSPYHFSEWSTFDTSGYQTWTQLHNSDTAWEIGALNRSGVFNTADMGWGEYDANTHAIVGSRLFLLINPDNQFYKLGINSLVSGTYKFTYMNLNESDSNAISIKKSDYSNSQFAYFEMGSKTVFEREPDANEWDLTFTKYIYNNYPDGNGGFIQYPVTGILSNKNIKIAEVKSVDVATFTDYPNAKFESKINVIGSDWKSFNGTQFVIKDSLLYFVKDLENNIWKLVFTGFTGSSEGKYIFSKQKIGNTSVEAEKVGFFTQIYPNPASNGQSLHLVSDFKNLVKNYSIEIKDIQGKTVYSQSFENLQGFNALKLPIEFGPGIYTVSVKADNSTSINKLIVN